ncbi:UPF0182 family membrane protein [Microbacterium gorillae]|uniref:UPF0182 family membrane protein n=1 Tax=Microbacterium gorillae TaxID=1231063 RepID=UPI00058F706B|nr:UPF0182 family protein [Microbacterium gorillae]
MTTTSAPNQATPNTGRRILVISLVILAALVAAFFMFANVFADFLWYDQLHISSVLITQWTGRITMFLVGFVGMALPVWGVIQLAYRLRPVYARLSSQLDRYQEVIEPLRRLAMWGIPIFFGVFAGLSSGNQWETAWMWANGVATKEYDPQFGLDTGFYMFALPFYSAVVAFVSAVLLISLLVTAFVSYLYGSVRIGQGELRISKAARIQLAVIAGLYILVQGVSLWLDRYRTLVTANTSSAGSGSLEITGPTYATANAVIPGQTILAIAAVLVAVMFFITAVIGRWRFPLVGTALLVVSALVLGIGYPWVVTTFQVKPNGIDLESTYYERNIEGTQKAFGIDQIEKTDFKAETTAEAGQLRADASTTASIRIMDPAIISPAVRQLEQVKPYYQFQQDMDVDRYEIDGKSQDVVVSVRELDMANVNDSWQNQTTVYTHGYGIVAAAGNQRTADGSPVFLEQGIPASGFISDEDKNFQPRVYFGEQSPKYSIVGAEKGAADVEMDYPRGADGATETKTTFTGNGGPKIDNLFTKVIYALKFQSEQILFSDRVNANSQILYDRDPKTRVQKAAPYLTLDSDPYPSVVDGHIVWIVDGYTTSSNYPYSTGVSLSGAIDDSTASNSFQVDDINYIRNSVKATVDAYDGSVTLYAWDAQDPVLQTWEKVYPNTIKPMSDMSAQLMSHVRYPTDLFKVQRDVLGVYHVDSARSLFQADNVWTTPNDPNASSDTLQPPYYLTMKMPGQDEAAYSMFTSFIPRAANSANARNVLTGYLAVDSDAGSTKGEKSSAYGKLRMLVIDSDTTVPGPGQVRSTWDSDPTVSAQLNVLKVSTGQSDVINGNLLTLPVGGGLLYVEPVYVQSKGSTKLPYLQKVLVAFGNQVAFEDTLSEALDTLFGGDSGAQTGDNNVNPTTPDEPTSPTGNGTTPTPAPTTSPSPNEGGTNSGVTGERDALLQEAADALKAREAAMAKGDWTAYGVADKQLTDALEKLIALEGK